jgi:hypothetical protein
MSFPSYHQQFLRWIKWSGLIYIGAVALIFLFAFLFFSTSYLVHEPQLNPKWTRYAGQPSTAQEWLALAAFVSLIFVWPIIAGGGILFSVIFIVGLLVQGLRARSFSKKSIAAISEEVAQSNSSFDTDAQARRST